MPRLVTRVKHLEPSRAFTIKIFPLPDRPDDVWEYVKGEYRYEMNGPPPRNDPVYRAIIRELVTQQKTDISVAALRLGVSNMTTSPLLWPVTPASPPKKLYALREFGEQFPMTIEVKLVRNCRNLNGKTILVRKKNDRVWRWKPLKDFASALPDRERLKHDVIGVRQAWWRLNGKHFPLMQLPTDLR
jgi:hypothetical protein